MLRIATPQRSWSTLLTSSTMARTAPALTALQRRAAERSYPQLGRRTEQVLGALGAQSDTELLNLSVLSEVAATQACCQTHRKDPHHVTPAQHLRFLFVLSLSLSIFPVLLLHFCLALLCSSLLPVFFFYLCFYSCRPLVGSQRSSMQQVPRRPFSLSQTMSLRSLVGNHPFHISTTSDLESLFLEPRRGP